MRWVRAIISIAMAGTVIYGFIIKIVPWEAFAPIAVGAIGWWYYDRGKEKKAETQAKLDALEAKILELTKGRTSTPPTGGTS